jgi:hypothetical protein
MPVSKETFSLGHSLISNKMPKGVALDKLDEIEKEINREMDLESLGLFNTSSPDFNKFYPNLSPEDLVPQDKDFAYPLFRALSKVIVNKYGPIDFSKPGVLEASTKKLSGQSVYTNHEVITGNEVGSISEVFFEQEKKINGVTIPAGINVRLKLDGKANPKLVRGIMMDPPSVHSVSVTVMFVWEKSHDMTDEEFYTRLGTYSDKGELVRRVVKEVFSYDEISLVPHGADPFAQKINEKTGNITNPEYADNRYSFSEEDFKEMAHHFDWKCGNVEELSLSVNKTIPNDNNKESFNNKLTTMNEEYLKFLRNQLKLSDDTPEAQVMEKLKAGLPDLLASSDKVGTLESELTEAKDDLKKLQEKYPEGTIVLGETEKEQLNEYKTVKPIADAALEATRSEALKLYHLSCGGADKADTAMTELIAKANFETITALQKQYRNQVEKEFTATCKDCNSTNISRMSTADRETGIANPNDDGNSNGGDKDKSKETFTEKSLGEAMDDIMKKKSKGISAHISEEDNK